MSNHPTPASSAGSEQTDDIEALKDLYRFIDIHSGTHADRIARNALVTRLEARIARLTAALSEAEAERDRLRLLAAEACIVADQRIEECDDLRAALTAKDAELQHARTFAPPNAFGAHTMDGLLSECETYRTALRERDAELARLREELAVYRRAIDSLPLSTRDDVIDACAAARSPATPSGEERTDG